LLVFTPPLAGGVGEGENSIQTIHHIFFLRLR
jgi:hypothetical protein